MHLHLVRIVARPQRPLRPAKVVVLETRRKARLDAMRPERQPPRPAAWDEEPPACFWPAAPRADVAEPEYAPVSETGGLSP